MRWRHFRRRNGVMSCVMLGISVCKLCQVRIWKPGLILSFVTPKHRILTTHKHPKCQNYVNWRLAVSQIVIVATQFILHFREKHFSHYKSVINATRFMSIQLTLTFKDRIHLDGLRRRVGEWGQEQHAGFLIWRRETQIRRRHQSRKNFSKRWRDIKTLLKMGIEFQF